MSATIIDIATRRAPLRLVEPTLEQRLQGSLALSERELCGRRVIVKALGLTARIDRWSPDMKAWRVTYDCGEVGYHDLDTLTLIGSQGDGTPGDVA